jgi:hypothetical protein
VRGISIGGVAALWTRGLNDGGCYGIGDGVARLIDVDCGVGWG